MLLSTRRALLCLRLRLKCQHRADQHAIWLISSSSFMQAFCMNVKGKPQMSRQMSTHTDNTCKATALWFRLILSAQPVPVSPTACSLHTRTPLGCSNCKSTLRHHGQLHGSPPCRASWRFMQLIGPLHNPTSLPQQQLRHPSPLPSSRSKKHMLQAC